MEITNEHQLEEAKKKMKEGYLETKKLIEKLPHISKKMLKMLKCMEQAMLEEGIEK